MATPATASPVRKPLSQSGSRKLATARMATTTGLTRSGSAGGADPELLGGAGAPTAGNARI